VLYRPLARTWTELDRNHEAGATELHLKDDPVSMGWRVGDTVGVATTSRLERVGNPMDCLN
jgi:hypothetical protein